MNTGVIHALKIMLIIAIHAETGLREITAIRIRHFAGDVSSRIITSATIAGNWFTVPMQ